MSHKTTIKTKITNKTSLKNALNKLGIKFQEGKLKTKGNYAVHEDVDILLNDYGSNSLNDSIGFKQDNNGNYNFTGDFYALRDDKGKSVTQKELTNRITNAYNFEELNNKLGSMGFNTNSTEIDFSNKEINYVMQRMV